MLADVLALVEWPFQAQMLKLAYLRGFSVDDVQSWIQSVWESEIVGRLYKGWYDAIPRLQAQGDVIVLLSGTLQPLAQPLAELFHIQYTICAEPEIINQRYSGRLLKPHPKGPFKVSHASEWLQAHGGDWNDTVAVADNWPDRFLLSRAHPVVVQPGRRLARYAQQHHWPIVDDANDGRQIMESFERITECNPQER